MINGRSCLHVVVNGTMTDQRYIDEVLLPHIRLFRGAFGDKFVFMDDNATCHRTLAVQDCLDSEGIQRLVWPARSPDLNPIANVWDALGRQVAGRNYPPTNKNTLIRALTEEWDKLPQQLLDNVVQRKAERRQHLMDLCYFRCCPRHRQFHRRPGRILLARKLQSSHHLAYEIHSLLHRIPSRCLPNHTTEIPQISLTLGFPVIFGLTRNNW
ncbi:transposable element Tc3 transposase [Trichonephila clavipes]|nr:transposable element Tc3 transposase [Trichonephila clavipes]